MRKSIAILIVFMSLFSSSLIYASLIRSVQTTSAGTETTTDYSYRDGKLTQTVIQNDSGYQMTTTYRYSGDNLLSKREESSYGSWSEWTYSYEGSLVKKLEYDNSADYWETFTFVYDGNNISKQYLEGWYLDEAAETIYEYDQDGNMTREYTMSEGNIDTDWTFEYENGLMIEKYGKMIEGFWEKHIYDYDDDGNMIKETYTDSYGDTEIMTWEYENGLPVYYESNYNYGDYVTTTTYEYDGDGNLITEYQETTDGDWWETVYTYSQ